MDKHMAVQVVLHGKPLAAHFTFVLLVFAVFQHVSVQVALHGELLVAFLAFEVFLSVMP